jgi:hypothetical protein
MGCSAKIRKMEDGEMGLARPWALSSAASSGPVQRDSGTPVAAGSWQASAATAARPGQVLEPVQPAGGLPTGTPQEALDTACTIHLTGLGPDVDGLTS